MVRLTWTGSEKKTQDVTWVLVGRNVKFVLYARVNQ